MIQDNTNNKLRAVFLASLMFFWLFAGTVAFAGGAAAQPAANSGEVEFNVVSTTSEDADLGFQGQDAVAVLSGIDVSDGDTVQVREVNEFDDDSIDDSSFVEELDVEEAGDVDIDGIDLVGDFGNIEDESEIVVIDTDDFDATQHFIRGGTADEVRDNTYEVAIQELDAEFDEDDLPAQNDDLDDSLVELDIDSGRSSYAVNVSADGDLDDEELFNIFTLDSLDGFEITDGNSQDHFDSANTPFEFEATDDGELQVVDDSGDVVQFVDDLSDVNNIDNPGDSELEGEDAVFGSPFEALETALSGDHEVEPFDPFFEVDRSDNTPTGEFFEHNGDFITVTGTTIGDFNVGLYAEGFDDDTADFDEKIVISGNLDGDVEEDVSFAGIDEDTYDFDFEVADTEAVASDTAEVVEEDVSIDFEEDVMTQSAGDIVRVHAELEDTDEAYIQFGSEDSNFVDILYIEDDEGNDEVEFYINTRVMGQAGVDNDEVVHSPDDIVESFIAQGGDFDQDELPAPEFIDGDDADDDDEFTGGPGNFDAFSPYLEELDTLDNDDDEPTEQLIRPLQAADYDVVATGNNIFYADDGESDVEDEDGFATVDLTRPELGETNIWVGPEEDADEEDTIAELVEDSPLTQRDEVAIDDLMVAQIEASGLYGAMVHEAGDFDPVVPEEEEGFEGEVLYEIAVDQNEPWENEGIELTFEDEDPVGNQAENALDLEDADEDEVFILVDNEAGELYIVVDTDDEPFDRDIDDGDTFEVELEYETDDDDRAEFIDDPGSVRVGPDGEDEDESYPYYLAGEGAVTGTSFTFADRAVTFDNLDEDDVVQLEAGEEVAVSGETNVAPGAESSVRVRQRGDTESFLNTQSVDIEQDGTFEGTFDFSARAEGDEARVSFRASGERIDEENGVFVDAVEEVEEETPTPTPEETPEPDTPEDTPEPEPDTPEEETPEPDDQAGFGAVIALIALLGAALLAARRNALN